MQFKLTITILMVFVGVFGARAQQNHYHEYITRVLAHDSLAGRGYLEDTQLKAAKFIYQQFDSLGLSPVKGGCQNFSYNINTFNKPQSFIIDGERQKPGSQFLFLPDVRTFQSKLKPVKKALKKPSKKSFFVVDALGKDNAISTSELIDSLRNLATVIVLKDKLQWHLSLEQHPAFPVVETNNKAILNAKEVEIISQAEHIKFNAKNVIFKYEPNPKDSFTVVCGHYDHLGVFGSASFNGASDNASGVATMLALASKIMAEKPQKNFLFIAFAAEESGLLGSFKYVNSPPIPLSRIKEVINLDINSDASEGITIVNGKENLPIYHRIKNINDEYNYLNKIFLRPMTANSDHFWFAQAKIPAIFIYTNGNYTFYHDVYDRYEAMNFAKQSELIALLFKFLTVEPNAVK
jgi:aminopeptidase YwaD